MPNEPSEKELEEAGKSALIAFCGFTVVGAVGRPVVGGVKDFIAAGRTSYEYWNEKLRAKHYAEALAKPTEREMIATANSDTNWIFAEGGHYDGNYILDSLER